MKKIFLFCLFFCVILQFNAQDDEYVIEKPKNPIKTGFEKIKNPDYTNYLLSASAYTLKEGEIRVANTDIIFAKGSYGLTDNTTATLHLSLIGTLVASIKHQINLSDDLKMGISASAGHIAKLPTDSTIYFAGIQSMVTLGEHQNNITFGAGFYYAKSTFNTIIDEKEFLLSNVYIATQRQLGKKIYLIAEGIYFTNYNILSGSLGIKITLKKTMTLGAGLMPISSTVPSINTKTIALALITFRMLFD